MQAGVFFQVPVNTKFLCESCRSWHEEAQKHPKNPHEARIRTRLVSSKEGSVKRITNWETKITSHVSVILECVELVT